MPSLGGWSSSIRRLRPSLDHDSDDGPDPGGVSSSKIATGGAAVAAPPVGATWIAYWQTAAPLTAKRLQLGSWFSTHATRLPFAGSGAGSARSGIASLAVSAHGMPNEVAPAGLAKIPCIEALPSEVGD